MRTLISPALSAVARSMLCLSVLAWWYGQSREATFTWPGKVAVEVRLNHVEWTFIDHEYSNKPFGLTTRGYGEPIVVTSGPVPTFYHQGMRLVTVSHKVAIGICMAACALLLIRCKKAAASESAAVRVA